MWANDTLESADDSELILQDEGDAVSLRVFRGQVATQRDAELSCRDVFAASPHAIECIGPALLAEASAPHQGFWK